MVPDSQLRSDSIFFMLIANEMIRVYRLLGSYRMDLVSRIARQDLKGLEHSTPLPRSLGREEGM